MKVSHSLPWLSKYFMVFTLVRYKLYYRYCTFYVQNLKRILSGFTIIIRVLCKCFWPSFVLVPCPEPLRMSIVPDECILTLRTIRVHRRPLSSRRTFLWHRKDLQSFLYVIWIWLRNWTILISPICSFNSVKWIIGRSRIASKYICCFWS